MMLEDLLYTEISEDEIMKDIGRMFTFEDLISIANIKYEVFKKDNQTNCLMKNMLRLVIYYDTSARCEL